MSPRPKIHVIVKYFYPVAAGIETNILETYSILVHRGWDVTVHTSRDTLSQKNAFPPRETIRGLTVIRYPLRWYGYWPHIEWNKSSCICLHNFNVSHFSILLFTLFRKLIFKKNYSLVVTPHGGFTPEWSVFPRWVSWLKQAYHFTIGTWCMNHIVDKVRAVSEWEKQEIIAQGIHQDKVVTISNGIEDEAFQDVDQLASHAIKRRVKNLGRYLIQVGRIYPIKNYETSIKALPLLPNDINYVIVGPIQEDSKNKHYKQQLDNLIKNLHLENRVFFLGVVRGIDKYFLIRHATLMVHMSVWESFCNAVHEGMSQGLVCLVANNYALPYLVHDGINGYLVPTYDHQKLAKIMRDVLDNMNNPEIKKIKTNNVLFAKDHSWEHVAVTMHHLYSSL